MAEEWAAETRFYQRCRNPNRESELAKGFGLSMDQYRSLKQQFADCAWYIKGNKTYRGNQENAKKADVEAFLVAFPQLRGKAPRDWTQSAVLKIMGTSIANRLRHNRLSAGAATPASIPQAPPYMTQSERPSTTPTTRYSRSQEQTPSFNNFNNAGEQQLPGPGHSSPSARSDIHISIRWRENGRESEIGMTSTANITPTGRDEPSWEMLQTELSMYEELDRGGKLARMYLRPWSHQHLAIRTQSMLTLAYEDMKRNRESKASISTIPYPVPPPSLGHRAPRGPALANSHTVGAWHNDRSFSTGRPQTGTITRFA